MLRKTAAVIAATIAAPSAAGAKAARPNVRIGRVGTGLERAA